MNNFPAMTEAQIKWMSAHCVRVMSESSPGDFEYLTAQIALAALTAETDYVRYSCGCCGYESLSYKHICPKCNHHTLHADKLYTAPTAPVLKLPDEKRMPNLQHHQWADRALCQREVESWNAAIAEVKHLNGVQE